MKGMNTTFGSVLLSATDYFDFCQMMFDVNQGGEAVFCPPLIDCDDLLDERVTKAESKCFGEGKEEKDADYNHESKSQCK